MIAFEQVIILVCVIAAFVLAGVIAGAFVMFRGRRGPGEGFFAQPKGEVFSIPEADKADAFPEEEILERTNKFLSALEGKK